MSFILVDLITGLFESSQSVSSFTSLCMDLLNGSDELPVPKMFVSSTNNDS